VSDDDNTLSGQERRQRKSLALAAKAITDAAKNYGFEYRCWAFDRAADVLTSVLDAPSIAFQKYEIDSYTEKFAALVRRIEVLGAMLRGETVEAARVGSGLEVGEGRGGYQPLFCPCVGRNAYLHTERVEADGGETFITMSCECCDRVPVLSLTDHKGNIHVRWLDPEEERLRKSKPKPR
jgi:hypothetical protein